MPLCVCVSLSVCLLLCVPVFMCVCAPYRAAPAPPASLNACDPLAALSVASASLSPEVPFIRPLDPPRAQLKAQHSRVQHFIIPRMAQTSLKRPLKALPAKPEVEAGAEEEAQTEAAFNMFVF